VDREGKEEPIAAGPNDYRTLNISPDGTQIALSIFAGGNQDIHIKDISRENPSRLTFDVSDEAYPLWTPDGKSIVYVSRRDDGVGLFQKFADGTGEAKAIGSLLENLVVPCSWSNDGKILVLLETPGNSIGMLNMEGNKGIETLLKERRNVFWPRISPDGQWMLYASDELGQTDVYVRPFPDVDKGRWLVSTNGGMSPLWSRDGREIFYWTYDGLMVVSVEAGPTFIPGTPKVQFPRTPVFSGLIGATIIPYDISPDGDRFLILKPSVMTDIESSWETPQRINIVLNWFEELKERVPAP